MLEFFYLISGPLFKHLKKRGISVIYWVLNEEKDFKRAVDVIIIYIIDLLLYLERSQWNND